MNKENDIKQKMQQAYDRLSSSTSVDPHGSWLAITLPFKDWRGDYMVMYARRSNKGYIFTDEGWCYRDYQAVVGSSYRDDFRRVMADCCPQDIHMNDQDHIILYTDPHHFTDGFRAMVSVLMGLTGVSAYEQVLGRN